MWQPLWQDIQSGDERALARCITAVENGLPGVQEFLAGLPPATARIIGLTGPPGAGKSTLADALIAEWTVAGKRVAVLCVDPSSPFHLGALLGDRIRMSHWYTHPGVYIRSLATRGSLGGLHPGILEISTLVAAAGFDYLLIETVGVGQSEIEIAGLADTTVVVLVPEAGDEVQTMKAGLMEIADVFVVNKSDRPQADLFVKALHGMLAPAFGNRMREIPILKTVAQTGEGVDVLARTLAAMPVTASSRRAWLLADRVWRILQDRAMQPFDRAALLQRVQADMSVKSFNPYRLAEELWETR